AGLCLCGARTRRVPARRCSWARPVYSRNMGGESSAGRAARALCRDPATGRRRWFAPPMAPVLPSEPVFVEGLHGGGCLMAHGRLVRMVTGAVVAGSLATTTPAPVSARVVTTEEALSATPASARAALEALLARDDVRAQFEALGVDPAQARERVQALDDHHVRELAAP